MGVAKEVKIKTVILFLSYTRLGNTHCTSSILKPFLFNFTNFQVKKDFDQVYHCKKAWRGKAQIPRKIVAHWGDCCTIGDWTLSTTGVLRNSDDDRSFWSILKMTEPIIWSIDSKFWHFTVLYTISILKTIKIFIPVLDIWFWFISNRLLPSEWLQEDYFSVKIEDFLE